MERWDHGERSRGGAPARSPRRRTSNAALSVLGWLHGGDGEVEGVKAGLRAVGIGQRRDSSSSRARRARGGGGASVLRPGERGKGEGENGGKLGVSRRAWRPGVCVLAAASTRVGHAVRTSCARSAMEFGL
jgi:hypothetical protein